MESCVKKYELMSRAYKVHEGLLQRYLVVWKAKTCATWWTQWGVPFLGHPSRFIAPRYFLVHIVEKTQVLWYPKLVKIQNFPKIDQKVPILRGLGIPQFSTNSIKIRSKLTVTTQIMHKDLGAICVMNYFKYSMICLIKKCYFLKFRWDMSRFFIFGTWLNIPTWNTF